MFKIRDDEPTYAFLKDEDAARRNRYGEPIDLTTESGAPKGKSLNINGDPGVGTNPNRNKQHGFHFTADNCIGCHACEAACSEKNDLPAHLSFRSVGYVEGGTYPSFTRMNISMACNHCDDPVCLKGCPTRAYTKHPEYGAVIQDPDICFGCGYCTWVCPYNAPQLDPVAGRVEKCNMCVDRLEVGLKPACVSACLGNALNFGVMENIPENRVQAETRIPGFPDPAITHPNIRFQQIKSLPRDLTRTDSAPLKYHRDGTDAPHRTTAELKTGAERRWNLSKLSSRENPLVIFTLTTQAVIGAFILMFLGPQLGLKGLDALAAPGLVLPTLFVLVGLQTFVLWLSTQHLGKPLRFYRGFNNLRHSPLSREALGIGLFLGFMGAQAGSLLFEPLLGPALTAIIRQTAGWAAVISALAGLYFMHGIYRIKARPFWDHWQVLTSFFGTMASLGGVLTALLALPYLVLSGLEFAPTTTALVRIIALGLALEGIGLIFHARALKKTGGEGAASFALQTTRFGKTYIARNFFLGWTLLMSTVMAIVGFGPVTGLSHIAVMGLAIAVNAVVGRALFYVMVIPTTMPGAFFWKNKAFEEHARETGLAQLPQVGVVPEGH